MVKLEHLLALFDANNEQDWTSVLTRLAYDLGFQHALFGIVPDRSTPLESAFLVSNYPQEWRTTYDNEGMHRVDPTVVHCLQSTLPIIWKPATFRGEEQGQFYEQACAYGLRSGITLPMHGAGGEFGVLSFVAGDGEHAGAGHSVPELAALSLMRDYALESSRKFTARGTAPAKRIKLTEREHECLKWVAAGKTSWEVSRILGRSEATVNYHIANIMRKFDVQTRQQAVVKAIKTGMVDCA